MKIATFNVNGINARLPRLLEWLAESEPDVVCLQELKCVDAVFPEAAIAEAGYRAIWHGPDFSQDWHTFALDWQPDSLTWYVDGVEHWTYPNASHVSEKDMYLLINLAVGGDWPGDPDSSTPFPSAFEIDYVRIWQRVP